jgi:uncharacterized protein YceH (UPF0502 family)
VHVLPAIIGSLDGPSLVHLQDREAAVRRLRAMARAAAEKEAAATAAAESLDASHRAVIRDLGQRVMTLSRANAQLAAERDRLQVSGAIDLGFRV